MLETIDPSISITKDEYLQNLIPLQVAIHSLGYQVYVQQRPVILVYEGWDAAGKGGSIKRVTEKLDPRGYVVHAIAAPKGDDSTHHYMWRFWRRLPEKGQIAIFDRSWYGRVMVERIEGFCTEEEWKRAFREINHFERQLVDFGVIIFKFWIHISKEEQLRRFQEREKSQIKAWKLTDEDWRNRERWNETETAVNEMLRKTSTLTAPWTIVEGNCKWHARIKVLKTLVEGLSRELDYDPHAELALLETKKKKKSKKKKRSKKSVSVDNEKSSDGLLPMIQSFEYEEIIIDGKKFTSDVVIFPDGKVIKWKRNREHELQPPDIKKILKANPGQIIIGLGTIGNLHVLPEVYEELMDAEIEILAFKTEKAIETYKEHRSDGNIAALFHIGD
jgi:polyphosphate kinase 2 (PPK2 family)